MAALLLMTVLAGFGLEIHPGETVRAALGQARRDGAAAALRVRLSGLLAVGGLLAVVQTAVLIAPGTWREAVPLRVGLLLLAATALVCAGWHRISTTSRLDLRRSNLFMEGDDGVSEAPLLDAGRRDLRRPGWHLFWWAVAPGVVVSAMTFGPLAPAALWLAYALLVLTWSLVLATRARRDRDRILGTALFRTLHSLGGLALVTAAGALLVSALAEGGVPAAVTDHVLGPLLGAGGPGR